MNNDNIFRKTEKGQAEIEVSNSALDMLHRRVLILVNGEKNIETLQKQSLSDNVVVVLENLVDMGMVSMDQTTLQKTAQEKTQMESAPSKKGSAKSHRPMSYL